MGGLLVGPIFEVAGKVIDRIFPDKAKADEAKLEILRLQQQGEFKALELEYGAMAKQADTNIEEAKNPNLFVSGWRPGAGWICVAGLGYTFLARPILVMAGAQAPQVELGVLMELLFALLGVAGLRTYEKIKGVAK